MGFETGINQGLLELKSELSGSLVHVWYVWTDRISHTDAIKQLPILSTHERSRFEAFRFAQDRHAFLIAHCMVRYVIGGYQRLLPAELQFETTQMGKPYVVQSDSDASIEFNLTHTRSLVACAVAKARVGIDIESSERVLSTDLAGLMMAPFEQNAWMLLSASDRHRRLLECWTLKEAYLKGTGMGLKQPLQSFGFQFQDDGPVLYTASKNPTTIDGWLFKQDLQYFDKHFLAVALESNQHKQGTQELAPIQIRYLDGLDYF